MTNWSSAHISGLAEKKKKKKRAGPQSCQKENFIEQCNLTQTPFTFF